MGEGRSRPRGRLSRCGDVFENTWYAVKGGREWLVKEGKRDWKGTASGRTLHGLYGLFTANCLRRNKLQHLT